jgi:hypothetical protein
MIGPTLTNSEGKSNIHLDSAVRAIDTAYRRV